MSETNTASRYITTKQLATELHMTPNAVRIMRHRGGAPEGTRVGRNILYDRAAVEAWMAGRLAADPLAQRAAA